MAEMVVEAWVRLSGGKGRVVEGRSLWRGAIKAIDTQSSGVDGVRCWLRPGLSSEMWTPRKVFR